jgi:hypothetical protein
MITTNKGEDGTAIAAYVRKGERMAYELGNRGPIEFNSDGTLRKEILDAYWCHGFYVFEGVVGTEELRELQSDLEHVFERGPHTKDALIDSRGRPALGKEQSRRWYTFAKPLSDPVGGTPGRHPVKMAEGQPPVGAPDFVISNINSPMQIMDSCLRLYGHPQLLSIAEAINGPDFTPFSDSIIVKPQGLGTSVAWHQDGTTLWNEPDWDQGTHGFNFMFQYFGSTAVNGVWVIPASHKQGKMDIKGMIASNGGSDRLPGAVPMVCEAGDIVISNRQLLHASFPNSSPHKRVTFNFGFHRRSSVLGARRKQSAGQEVVYDEERVFQSSRLIAVGIDARHQRFSHEPRYVYRPLAGQEDTNRWNEDARENIVKDYNRRNLSL